MKYISYFIFISFIALLLFFLKSALEPAAEPLYIKGAVQCGECHGLKNNGNQLDIWKNSGHSKAYTSLLSEKAKEYSAENNLGPAAENRKCLKCHTTAGILEGTEIGAHYEKTEGVGCEACHGAGSEYSRAEIMKDRGLFELHGGTMGDEKTCLKCHREKAGKDLKPSDDNCPFQQSDFNYKTMFEKIKHPVNR